MKMFVKNQIKVIILKLSFEEGRKKEWKLFVNICLVLGFLTIAPLSNPFRSEINA